ncbi:hypothetical protein [Kribbella speibonae]|nr:hypothetical protein [Kribbella speibonae]
MASAAECALLVPSGNQFQLWNTDAQPDYRWSAEDYSTPDLLPFVG